MKAGRDEVRGEREKGRRWDGGLKRGGGRERARKQAKYAVLG